MNIKDSLYGFIVGDALGVPFEFHTRRDLNENPVTTMTGHGTYDMEEGVFSDDSSMTLATLSSIIRCKNNVDYEDIATEFLEWIDHGKYTATSTVFDVGITTKYALERYREKEREAIKCGGNHFGDNGNGSLMRMVPIAFYIWNHNLSNEEMIPIIENTSSITHRHSISIMACFIYIKFLLFLLEGKSKIESYEQIKKEDYSHFEEETQKVFHRILEENIQKKDIDQIKSGGYVVDTLEAVIWTILNTNSYEEAVLKAVNLGDDTDTVAAITGSIAGIIYGFESIPKEWIEKIKNKELINQLIAQYNELIM